MSHEIARGRGVQRRRVRPGAGGEHERRLWAVEHDAGGALRVTGLQEIGLGNRVVRRGVEHREDRADRHIDVNVGGAVERIERHQEPAVSRDRRDPGALFGRERPHRGFAQTPLERVVGEQVELFLGIAVAVDPDSRSERAGECAAPDMRGDRSRGGGDRGQRIGEIGRRGLRQERLEFAAWRIHWRPPLSFDALLGRDDIGFRLKEN